MTFTEHPEFFPAPTPESRLWRYMSLAKYLSLIQRRALFFSSLELMAATDPFEGSLPSSRFKYREWNSLDDLPEHVRRMLSMYRGRGGIEGYRDFVDQEVQRTYAYRKSFFVNCWHLNDYESSAMWNIYSSQNEGIAIVSSESRIAAAMSEQSKRIFGGRVSYGDYADENFVLNEWSAFPPILHKRVSFAYEDEYRLVYWDTSVTHVQGSGVELVERDLEEIKEQVASPGHYVACDLNKLIDKVMVSPLAVDWFFEVVREVSESVGLPTPVKSNLLTEPLR
jgi:hypothetical protein